MKSFSLSEELFAFSKDLQMLVTTHSPAFYSLNDREGVKTFYVSKKNTSESTFDEQLSNRDIHEKIGLMPLVAPFIKDSEEKLKEYEELLNGSLRDVDTILVEGKTDKKYIEKAIAIFSPVLKSMIDEGKLLILASENEGGTGRILNLSLAWIYARFHHKCIVLTDNDSAGKSISKKYSEEKEKMSAANKNNNYVRYLSLVAPPELKNIQKQIKICMFEFAIEDLLPIHFWKELKDNNQIESIPVSQLKNYCPDDRLLDKSINEILNSYCLTDETAEFRIKSKVKDGSKNDVCQKAILAYDAGQTDIFDGFKPTIEELEKLLK